MTGVYDTSGGFTVALNDATFLGMYMPDGRLRVTTNTGPGITDASGALRVSAVGALKGVMSPIPTINDSDAAADSLKGAMAPSGALRLKGV